MKKFFAAVCVCAIEVMLVASASAQTDYAPARARTYAGEVSRPLTVASSAAPTAVVAAFLRAQGRDVPEASLVRAGSPVNARDGVTTIRLEQVVAGLRLYGAYAKASFGAQGELVYLIENLAASPPSSLTAPRVSAAQGLDITLRRLYPGQSMTVGAPRANGNAVVFDRTAFFHAPPTVTRVAVQSATGPIRAGLLVETWSDRDNLLHHTLLGPTGDVLSVELRTNSDSYNVFPISPRQGGQTVTAGAGGWLFAGPQNSINITGNNVHGYLDAVRRFNEADPGGVAITSGDFLTAANLTTTPSTPSNSEVAVQNLFYHNNVIHDVLYAHGFTEAAGNFQEDNFGNGGLGGDSVNAEAQDGSGTNNANFATPSDGQHPRMQVYLWDGADAFEVIVNSPTADRYAAAGADFGPLLKGAGLTGDVVVGQDTGTSTSDGCEALTNVVTGKIVLVDRGTCNFIVKAENAQAAGAIGLIVANNTGGTDVLAMGSGGSHAHITIPAIMISQNDGADLKGLASPNVTMRPNPNSLMIDAALDTDVIYHEYGHGLSWRMIGGMSGPIAGALGEGTSDVVAMLVNGDDRIGEYAQTSSTGIRRAPYANYPNTYGDVTGAEVHNDGEIYAASVWRLKELLNAAGLTNSDVLDLVVDAMNFIPETPTYEQMRDGLLAATDVHDCLVWQAFAQFGIGEGSSATVSRRGVVTVTESFTVPTACQTP